MNTIRTISDVLRDKADETKKGITFVENRRDVFVPYGRVHAEAVAAATRLAEAGIGPGDRVIFQVSENRGLIRAFWGCVYAGAVPALAPPVSGPVDVDRVRTLSDMMPGAPILVDERSYTLLTGANGAVVVGEDRLLDVSIVNDAAAEPDAAMPGDAESDFSQAGDVDSGDGAGAVPAFPVRGGTAGEALIQFSSGSTGSPKGVIVTNESVLNGLRATIPRHAHRYENKMLTWLPLTHNLSLIGFHVYALFRGYDQVLLPVSEVVADPPRWFEAVTRHRPTVTVCPNFAFKHFLRHLERRPLGDDHGYDFSNVQKLMSGSEPIDASLARKFLAAMSAMGLREDALTSAYGMSEACLLVTTRDIYSGLSTVRLDRTGIATGQRFEDIESESGAEFVALGKAVPGISLTIRDDGGGVLGDGTVGEIHIAGAPMTRAAITAEGIVEHELTDDGAFATGDMGILRDGELFVLGRKKDIIFVNGRNYYSADLEAVLENVLDRDVAVLGRSNPATGEEEIAVFLARRTPTDRKADDATGAGQSDGDEPPIDEQAVARSATTELMRVAGVPVSRVLWVDELPVASNGKKLRRKLEALL